MPRQRLEQPVPIELELLVQELALHREALALRADTPVERLRQMGPRVRPQRVITVDLLQLEPLLLHALLEVKLLQPARIGGAEIVSPCPGALLQQEIECIALLLDVQAVRVVCSARQCRCSEDEACGKEKDSVQERSDSAPQRRF